MKRGSFIFGVILFASGFLVSASQANENPVFGYPHLLQSPYTLPAGRLVYGTELAFGVTDFLQVGTSLLSNFYKVFNASAKVSLIDYPTFAMGIGVEWVSFNPRDFSVSNPDGQVTSWLPGVVGAVEVAPSLAWFLGANLNYTSASLNGDTWERSGLYRGARLGTDIAWAYNPRKKNGAGNVLAAGIDYDINYQLFGFGISHHWRGLHLGIHYYPNADLYRVRPILAGGGAIDF